MVPRMQRVVRLLFLLALASLALPASASAARRWTFDKTASVRNHDGDFIIGYAFANGNAPNTPTTDHIDVQTTRGPWKYGYVDGPFKGWGGLPACGWVLGGSGRMHPTTGSENVPNRCPNPSPRDSNSNPLAPQNIFAASSYAYGTGGGTVWPAVIQACPTGAFLYANYNPATKTFSNKYGQLPVGRGTAGGAGVTSGYSGFGWRYQTADGQAVLIKDTAKDLGGHSPADTGTGVPNWVFVRSACISRVPVFKGPGLRITKTSWGGGKVQASGRIANSVQYGVKVTFTCGSRTKSKTVRDKRGRWKAGLLVHCGSRKHGTLTAAYKGDGQYVAAQKSRGVSRG
jgi:hypothetical protein